MTDKNTDQVAEFRPSSANSTDDAVPETTAEAPAEEANVNDIPTGLQTPEETSAGEPQQITWTASEYMEHNKSIDWYLALAVVAILAAVGLYVLFRDTMTSAAVIVAAVVFGFYARRAPRQLHYQLDASGLSIGEKHFPYDVFRSFAIMDEGPFVSLVFLPFKRFGFLTTVYLDPSDEQRVIDLVNQYLPLEPRDHDAVDRFMKRIRF